MRLLLLCVSYLLQDMCKYLMGALAVLLLVVPITEVESNNDSELKELHIGGIFPIGGKGGW